MLSLDTVFARLTIWRSLLPKLDVGGSNPLARYPIAIQFHVGKIGASLAYLVSQITWFAS